MYASPDAKLLGGALCPASRQAQSKTAWWVVWLEAKHTIEFDGNMSEDLFSQRLNLWLAVAKCNCDNLGNCKANEGNTK